MSYKNSYESETVRIKVLYNENHHVDKVKMRMNSGYSTRADLLAGLKFLEKNGFVLNKRHEGQLTLEEIAKYRGVVGTISIKPDVKFTLVDDPSVAELSIDSYGLVDANFYLHDVINYMVDFLVAFQYFYNPHEYK